MAITGAIPLPSSGLEGFFQGANASSSLLSQMMQRRSAMEQMDRLRQMLPLDKQLKQAQIKNAGLAHMLDPLRKQLLQEQIKSAQNKNDPAYALKHLQSLLGLLGEDEENQSQGEPQGNQNTDALQSFITSIMPQGNNGMRAPGNMDLNNRPVVNNPQTGGQSTVWSMGVGTPEGETLIPRVSDDGKILSEQEAIDQFHKTGKNLGVFNDVDSANKYAEQLHKDQEKQYMGNEGGKKKGIFDKEYLKKALIYKALGLPVPREASASGYTPEMRQKEFEYKQKALDERMRHNKEMEKNANPDEKIRLAAEKAKIEAEKQRNVTDYKADAEYKKTLNKEEAKTYSKMENDATAGIAAQPVLQEMADVVSDPVFEEIRQHPYLGHQEFSYYKRSGTPEQQKLAARFEVAANKLIADTAKGLNTRFTDKDLMLAQSMKINDSDSLEVAKAKAESLLYLHEVGQKRLEKALEIASTQRVSPFAAIKQADAALNANQIREDIRNKVYKNGGALPSGVNEADIATTMEETGMTRAQVLEAYRKRIGK